MTQPPAISRGDFPSNRLPTRPVGNGVASENVDRSRKCPISDALDRRAKCRTDKPHKCSSGFPLLTLVGRGPVNKVNRDEDALSIRAMQGHAKPLQSGFQNQSVRSPFGSDPTRASTPIPVRGFAPVGTEIRPALESAASCRQAATFCRHSAARPEDPSPYLSGS